MSTEIDDDFVLDLFRRVRYGDRADEESAAAPKTWTEVFDEAAERVRGKIRGHGALFPLDEEVRSLLAYLADHLFDFDLDVNTWLAGCGCRRAAQDRFVATLGSLKSYLDEHRIAVAAEAIRKTSATIAKIGRRAGFETPRTFQRTFERVLGGRPSDLPRPSPGSGETIAGEAPDLEDPVHGTRLLATYWRRQVTLGLLDAGRAAELRRLLRERHEALRGAPWSRGLLPGIRIPVLRLLTGGDVEDPPIAFEPTQEAIRQDGDSAGWPLSRVCHEIYRHLSRPKLRLDQVLAAAELKQKSVWRSFTAAMGQSPWSYLRDARMEVAARLLLLTSLPATKICRRVGYGSAPTFHRAFREFTGLGPAEYRRRSCRLLERGGPPPWDFADADYWTRAVSGELMVLEAVNLDGYLEGLFPGEARSAP